MENKMEIKKPQDIFSLSTGDLITKRKLFDVIQYSKVKNSQHWGGEDVKINNTPQQGINWIGEPPACHGVIIKTRLGSYTEDGWSDDRKDTYRYSFKARGGEISYSEKANRVLINQPQHQYPIFLFIESRDSWYYEGGFHVSEILEKHVILGRDFNPTPERLSPQEETAYKEGGKKYTTHLIAERNHNIVNDLKENTDSTCEICHISFLEKYGVEYIEAHHKTPISDYTKPYTVKKSDFALLCPNCHIAVHIYMKKTGLEYRDIKKELQHIAA